MPKRLTIVALTFIAALVLSIAPALAHAGLIATDPPDGARLDTAPAAVSFTFTETVAPIRFSLVGSDGQPQVIAANIDTALVVMGLDGNFSLRRLERYLALIREGGSIPIVQAFKDVLGVDTLLLGLALPDCQAHAPNENFPVANFEAGMLLNQHLLRELAM